MEDVWFWLLLAFVLVGILLLFAFEARNREGQRKKIEAAFHSVGDFSPTSEFISPEADSGIALDESRARVCIAHIKAAGRVEADVFEPVNLIGSEIVQDGVTVMKTETQGGAALGRAVVGGLLLGPVGFLLGGLSGKKKSTSRAEEKVNRVELKVTVNDLSEPVRMIRFLGSQTHKGGYVHGEALKNATHWHGIIDLLIHRHDDRRADVRQDV